jgi:hypothetical protein
LAIWVQTNHCEIEQICIDGQKSAKEEANKKENKTEIVPPKSMNTARWNWGREDGTEGICIGTDAVENLDRHFVNILNDFNFCFCLPFVVDD